MVYDWMMQAKYIPVSNVVGPHSLKELFNTPALFSSFNYECSDFKARAKQAFNVSPNCAFAVAVLRR